MHFLVHTKANIYFFKFTAFKMMMPKGYKCFICCCLLRAKNYVVEFTFTTWNMSFMRFKTNLNHLKKAQIKYEKQNEVIVTSQTHHCTRNKKQYFNEIGSNSIAYIFKMFFIKSSKCRCLKLSWNHFLLNVFVAVFHCFDFTCR